MFNSHMNPPPLIQYNSVYFLSGVSKLECDIPNAV
jgi:hypothetical protein